MWFLFQDLASPECGRLQVFMPLGECAGEGSVSERVRGSYDPAMAVLAEELLANVGSVEAIMAKFSQDFATLDEKMGLKSLLLTEFPKRATKGICYIAFNSPPGVGESKGYLHPRLGRPTSERHWSPCLLF
jgi:hypothetical protein